MKFHSPDQSKGEYTFSDLFIFQQFSDIKSRSGVSLAPLTPLSTTMPIISANMNAVTGKRMSETLARMGGMGILPQDMSDHTMERIVKSVHNASLRYDTPITLSPDDRVKDAEALIYKRSHGIVLLVDDAGTPVGMRAIRDLEGQEQHTRLGDMRPRAVVLGNDDMTDEQMYDIMKENGIDTLPVLGKDQKLLGILTKKAVIMEDVLSQSLNKEGKLNVGIALGINNFKDRAEKFYKLGVDTFVLDTAHGYQARMFEAIKELRKIVGEESQIIAGNVVTAEATKELIKAGANGVKVGIGPGAMCTTRMQTGVGRPQFSAILECATQARKMGGYVWGDGGVKNPRDMALALAAGASHVMIGSILSGTYESTGDLKFDENGAFKINYGMASGRAVSKRFEGLSALELDRKWRNQEGISASKVYLKKGRESVASIVSEFITGLQSAMTYSGASNIEEYHDKVVIGVQTSSGYAEGKPHRVMD